MAAPRHLSSTLRGSAGGQRPGCGRADGRDDGHLDDETDDDDDDRLLDGLVRNRGGVNVRPLSPSSEARERERAVRDEELLEDYDSDQPIEQVARRRHVCRKKLGRGGECSSAPAARRIPYGWTEHEEAELARDGEAVARVERWLELDAERKRKVAAMVAANSA
eukprot:5033781-Pleurochrysis_carterae.AAC.1